MTPPDANLNENQQRRLRVTCEHIDRLLTEVEDMLNVANSTAAFPRYVNDILPPQRRLLEDFIVRARAQLARILEGQGIPRPAPSIPVARAVQTTLLFIEIAAEEIAPRQMRGYGALSPHATTEIEGIISELKSLVAQMNRIVSETGLDLQARLERLARSGGREADIVLLRKLEHIVDRRGWVEYRPAVEAIVERLEDRRFEIGIFGRVSTGKSSLLNAILDESVLPIGVTPITAVPTRIAYGPEPQLSIWYAERPMERLPLARLPEFVTEEHNPGNKKHVSRIVVKLPAHRLREGVTFVDTPGLGSLATEGAAETLAYLPRCDQGIVLVDSGSILTAEDVALIHALLTAAIPVSVLLSKADLVSAADRLRLMAYIGQRLESELGVKVSVWPVSIAGESKGLVDEWFAQEILPLYDHTRELKAASLRCKICNLQEAISAALQAQLRLHKRIAIPMDSARQAEQRLRQAAGRFAETRQITEKLMEALARSGPQFLREAAEQTLKAARTDQPAADTPLPAPGDRIPPAIMRAVQREAGKLYSQLDALARQQGTILVEIAVLLGLQTQEHLDSDKTGPLAELKSVLREMPIAEIALAKWEMKISLLGRVFGSGWAIASLARQFESQIGDEVRTALETYARLLDKWADRATSQMETIFNSYADTYRAQAERILAGESGHANNREGLEEDLKELTAANAGGL